MKDKTHIFLLILILLAGFFLRVAPIRFGLPSKNLALTTYNPDEPLSYYSLERMVPSKLDFSPKRAFLWGGFSVYILGFFLKISQVAGMVSPVTREFLIANLHEADKLYVIGRLISIIFGTLSILLIYLIAKKAYNSTTGLISAGLLCITAGHIINSFYVRPDVIMLFFALLGALFSVMIISGRNRTKYYVLAGICVGLATATKLSAGVYVIVPVLAHFIRGDSVKNKNLWILIASSAAGFLIGCPYSIFDFPTFWYYMKMNFAFAGGTTHPVEFALFGPGWLSYIRYYLPHAMGWPLLAGGLAGFVYITAKQLSSIKSRSQSGAPYDMLFLISGIIIYFVITRPKNQAAWYTLPVIPFFVLFAARTAGAMLSSKIVKKSVPAVITLLALVFIFAYSSVYSLANLNLYVSKNTREETSEWIKNNVPESAKVAIPRSYFWTPGILRQYNPPYNLLMGGDIQSALSEAVLGLDSIKKEADYVVLSEFEYRDYIYYPDFLANYFSKQEQEKDKVLRGAEILQSIMFNTDRFEEVARFNRQASFMGIVFRKNYPPHDWLIPNPEIIIYKKLK
ncbi:MAG: glycosyltransferase family 39 protein [Elusimicrobiota bacterium]